MGSGENSRNFHSTTTTKFQHFRFHHYSSNQSLIQNSLSTNEKTRNTILRGASLASHTNEIWKSASASHIVPPLRVTTNHHSDIPWSGEEPFTLLMIFKPPNMQLFRHNLACAFNQNISFTKIIKLGLLRTEMSFGHKIFISSQPYLNF